MNVYGTLSISLLIHVPHPVFGVRRKMIQLYKWTGVPADADREPLLSEFLATNAHLPQNRLMVRFVPDATECELSHIIQ